MIRCAPAPARTDTAVPIFQRIALQQIWQAVFDMQFPAIKPVLDPKTAVVDVDAVVTEYVSSAELRDQFRDICVTLLAFYDSMYRSAMAQCHKITAVDAALPSGSAPARSDIAVTGACVGLQITPASVLFLRIITANASATLDSCETELSSQFANLTAAQVRASLECAPPH